jgi:hypothetical protein
MRAVNVGTVCDGKLSECAGYDGREAGATVEGINRKCS